MGQEGLYPINEGRGRALTKLPRVLVKPRKRVQQSYQWCLHPQKGGPRPAPRAVRALTKLPSVLVEPREQV